jgi:hypothetical protein
MHWWCEKKRHGPQPLCLVSHICSTYGAFPHTTYLSARLDLDRRHTAMQVLPLGCPDFGSYEFTSLPLF